MTDQYTPTPAFETARHLVAKVILDHDQSIQLLAYSLYKQAREGDIAGSRPLFNPEGKVKYDTRTIIKGMAHAEADSRYLDCSEHMIQGKPLNPENVELLEMIKEKLRQNKSYFSSSSN